MATVIHFDSEADLCHEFPCFELFNPENRREVFEIRREHGDIEWCPLSAVLAKITEHRALWH
jgi:8-oxo-dGTP pyrophosphatase MutT (NUDIX family)